MASNSSSKGCGGANPAVQLEGSHIEQTINQSSTGENDLDLSDVSFGQMSSQGIECDEMAQWPLRAEELLIKLMVTEVEKDKPNCTNFKAKIWRNFEVEMTQKMGRTYTVPNLKEKYNRLKNKYQTFKKLLSTTGFGWDPETNTVMAEEDVWARYIKMNPQAKCFRKKGCDNFNLLGLIFGKSTATDILARASIQVPPNSDEKRELEEECMHGKKKSFVNLDDDLEGPFDSPPKKNASTSSQKESKSSKIDNAIDAWIAFSIARLEKYKRSGHNDLVDDLYSIEICMDVLEAMEDVDSQQYFRACAKFKDRDWRQMFLKMSALRKKEWLDILD